MLTEGIKNTKTDVVTEKNSAKTMGSGLLDVYATPSMVALMEGCCHESITSELEEGWGSVGTSLNIKHVSATPIGMKVRCESELVKVDGRALTFEVKAYDEKGLIGEGVHERFLIQNDKFMSKTQAKLQ